MNAKKAKALRKIAKSMVSSTATPILRFFVERQEDGSVKDTLVPMPLTWPTGTFRRIYKDLKNA
jgi:hypothetical protein